MSGDTLYEAPRKHNVSKMRVHDYLYDSAFIVSGARDYARTSFKAAMESAQVIIQPVYRAMFSELRKYPRMHVVYHPNCRLPNHMDRSYGAYLDKVKETTRMPTPQLAGRDRFMYSAAPKKVLALKSASPDFHPPTPKFVPFGPTKPRNRGTQSQFRESSAQTIPYQPDGKPADGCEQTPEVMYLDKLEWGPGNLYRCGDLPADFHTTEIINKMRHARTWMGLVEKGQFPRWLKKRDAIISDVETKDWIFREAEIDELQDIRLNLLHRLQSQQREKQTGRTSTKLAKLWALKKQEMERKIDHIRKTRDRELRKLSALHESGGRVGLVSRMRASRGAGSAMHEAHEPTSDLHAPLARHGYQARRRHATITYDPTLLSLEDHEDISKPPEWLEQCGRDLTRTCSGHHLPRDTTQLCERETKWSEQFLESLHNDLKKARLGAIATSAGPLHVLKPRRLADTPRPSTPEVEAVDDTEENCHQAALLLQRIIRGRAVQNLMYEGRTRAAELTEELKTTHGLQKEDKFRIAKEESKARDYNAIRTESEQKEDAISALVDELCGGAVAAALDFLEKELRRLREERRQHAFILIALREKTMREAAEAGRRQKEEMRRREHDEMFRQVLGVTQETVDAYLNQIIREGVNLASEADAVKKVLADAERIEESMKHHGSMSTAEQNELVAELVQQFLLPHAHKTAARHRIAARQAARLDAARGTIFGLLDDAEIKEETCTRCGGPLDDLCRCRLCSIDQQPVETTSRQDPRWRHTRSRPHPKPKTDEERIPPHQEIRCMLNTLVDEVVLGSRRHRTEERALVYELGSQLRENTEIALEAKDILDEMIKKATGAIEVPVKVSKYHYLMRRVVGDALERSQPFSKQPCNELQLIVAESEEAPQISPSQLPSEIRRVADEKEMQLDPSCRCDDHVDGRSRVTFIHADSPTSEERRMLLPSEVRMLEELRRCKCDGKHTPSSFTDESGNVLDEEMAKEAMALSTSDHTTFDSDEEQQY